MVTRHDGTLLRLAGVLRGHRVTAVMTAVVTLIAVIPTVLAPLLLGASVAAIEHRHRGGLLLISLALAGLGALGAAALAARTLLWQRFALDLETHLRERYYQRLLTVELDYVEQRSTGDLVSRGTVDLRQFRTVLGSSAPAAVQATATILAAAIVMIIIDARLAAVALAPLPVIALLGARYARSMRGADTETRRALGDVAGQAVEDVAGIAVIKGFAQEGIRLTRFREAVDRARASAVGAASLQARFGSAISVLPGIGTLAVLLYGGLLAARVHTGIADSEFVAFYGYVVLLVNPAQQVGWILGTSQTALAAVGRVLEVIDDDDPEWHGAGGAEVLLANSLDGVQLRGVSASYAGGAPVLRDVDLDVARGTTVAITGPTGSGKTTLLELIDRLRTPDHGTISVGGVPLSEAHESSLREQVSILADPDFLFSAPIRDNIAYGRPSASLDEIRRAATLAAADGFISALPGGYDTVVGERAVTLSGGQRQRIALARALLLEPSVLLLDNPTGSLDRATERDVLAGLARDARGRATLSISYRPVPLAAADQVLVLNRGAVAAYGRRDEVLAAHPGYTKLLGDVTALPRPALDHEADVAPAGPATAGAGGTEVSAADPPWATEPAPERAPEPAPARPPSTTRARLRELGSLLAGERRPIVLGALATIGAMALTIVPPYLGGLAVDDVVRPHDSGGLVAICAVLAGVLVFGALATACEIVLLARTGQELLGRLRIRVLGHLLALPMRFFDQASQGALISRLTNDVESLDQLLTGGLSVLIASVLTIVLTSAVLLSLDVELALATCAALPLALFATYLFSSRLSTAYRAVAGSLSALTVYLTETIAGMRTIRAFAQTGRHAERFAELNRDTREQLDSTVRLQARYLAFIELITGLALAGIILLGGNLAIDGTITVGVVVAFATYLRTAMAPIPSLIGLYGIYAQGMAGLDHTFELLAEPVLPEPVPAAVTLPRIEGALTVEDVSFAYDDENWVLKDVSLEVPAGSTIALVGLTGAGKSTLVKLLLRFYDPQQGRIAIDGRDLRGVPRASLRRSVGYVAQDPFLFSGTVWENIAFASQRPSRADARSAAEAVGVLDVLEQLPLGLDTPVGKRGEALSAGQRQLVALARATLGDRGILVLDEPTSSVDIDTEATIDAALKRLRVERTTIVVAHRLSTVREADRIYVIDAGRVAESGTHAELLAARGAYAQLYGHEAFGD